MHGWMSRRGSGWSLAAAGAGDGVGVLAREIWKRSVAPSRPLRARGVTSPFDVYVVADAWRGTAIDEAVKAFASDLATVEASPRALPDGTTLASGGAAHLVAWVGHDRWMDYTRWTPPEPRSAAPPKGTMAIACMSRQYLGDFTSTPGRLPLLLTTDYLFAGSHAFEGALRAFLDGAALGAIADAGARAYATGQGKPYGRVRYAFINPGDNRWSRGRRPPPWSQGASWSIASSSPRAVKWSGGASASIRPSPAPKSPQPKADPPLSAQPMHVPSVDAAVPEPAPAPRRLRRPRP